MNATRRGGLVLALATACISGVAVFLNSYGVKAVGDATVYTTAKNIVAAAVLLLLPLAVQRGGRTLTRPSTVRQWAGLAAVGVIGGSVPFVLFFEGLARASSVHAAFLQKTLVVWVALLAVPLLAERLTRWHWAAIGLLVAGQAALLGGVSTPLHMAYGRGEALILAATLLWAVEVVVAKRLLRTLSSWTVGVARMVLGSAVLIGWVAIRGKTDTLTTMTSRQWGWVLLTGLILAAYVATWFAALARAQAVDVTAVLVVGAVVTSALAALVDGVSMRPQLSGLALVLAGTLVMVIRMTRDRRVAVPER